MNQQQWLEWRRDGIGSSDAPVIMGVSPWKTPYQLWNEKLNGDVTQFENAAMTRGKNLEEEARNYFVSKMNVLIEPKNVTHPSFSWVRASLDGIDSSNKVLLEIKCPGKEDHFIAMSNKIPEKYIPQLQHQLLVTGLEGMYYLSYDGSEGVIVEVERDDDYINKLFKEEKKFWDSILNFNPPSLTEKDYVEQGSDWIKIAEKRMELAGKIKSLEKEDDTLKEQLIELSNNQHAIGGSYKFTKIEQKGAIEYQKAFDAYLDKLKEKYPEIELPLLSFDKYRKKSFTKWRLSNI